MSRSSGDGAGPAVNLDLGTTTCESGGGGNDQSASTELRAGQGSTDSNRSNILEGSHGEVAGTLGDGNGTGPLVHTRVGGAVNNIRLRSSFEDFQKEVLLHGLNHTTRMERES